MWQAFQERNSQENKCNPKTGIHSAMYEYGTKVSKSHEIGVQQRNTVCHIIEQVVVFGIQIKNRDGYISKQYNKGDGLILQDTHYEKRKAKNEKQGWKTDDQKIAQVGYPVYSDTFGNQVKYERFRKDDYIQDHKNDQVPDCFSGDIFAVRHRADVYYIGGIQFLIAFQEIGGQENSYYRLNSIQNQQIDVRNI